VAPPDLPNGADGADGAERIDLDVPASLKYLNVVGACVTEMISRAQGVEELEVVAYNVQLAVHEICTNVVDHAYEGREGGRIRLTFTMHQAPQRFVAELVDTGSSFDPSVVPDPDLEAGQTSGYGLFLARQLMDSVTYDPGPVGNRWRLEKSL
jgi:serine/threonine-protein kinase RsbW